MNSGYFLTGTKTAQNLAKAFAGECQARTRYLFYSDTAASENYPTLQQIFLETADNERGHAEVFNDYLTTGLEKTTLKPQALVPVALGDTAQNLFSASEGEHLEWTSLYPEFGHIAEQEGFRDIAESFYRIATIEKRHDERFTYLLKKLNKNMLYKQSTETTWVCSNCGLYIKGKSAPDTCPACQHPQSFFMTMYDQNYPYGYPKENEPCRKPDERCPRESEMYPGEYNMLMKQNELNQRNNDMRQNQSDLFQRENQPFQNENEKCLRESEMYPGEYNMLRKQNELNQRNNDMRQNQSDLFQRENQPFQNENEKCPRAGELRPLENEVYTRRMNDYQQKW